jgi:hypothetical protein
MSLKHHSIVPLERWTNEHTQHEIYGLHPPIDQWSRFTLGFWALGAPHIQLLKTSGALVFPNRGGLGSKTTMLRQMDGPDMFHTSGVWVDV